MTKIKQKTKSTKEMDNGYEVLASQIFLGLELCARMLIDCSLAYSSSFHLLGFFAQMAGLLVSVRQNRKSPNQSQATAAGLDNSIHDFLEELTCHQ